AAGRRPAHRPLEPASCERPAPPRGCAPTTCSRQLLAAERPGPVETVHSSFYARVEGQLKRVGHAIDDGGDSSRLGLREPTQHVAAAGRRTLPRGLADTDPKTDEAGCAERADDRKHSVVARAGGAALATAPA